jgi:hypothetical protein
MGMAVPAWTGRRTWVGHHAWTPDYHGRRALAEQLFTGGLPASRARRLVQEIRPVWLLADCRHRRDLTAELRPLVAARRRFGCATVYRMRVRDVSHAAIMGSQGRGQGGAAS